MALLAGILWHGVGAANASFCFAPQKRVNQWAWQTYWVAQALFCWLLLPMVVAYLTIPNLLLVLQEAPREAMWKSFVLGMGYGIGGTAFGLAIRYVGFSITYAVSVGLSCVLGTLLPPILKGELSTLWSSEGAQYVFGGILLGVLGIIGCGWAGYGKEKGSRRSNPTAASGFSIQKGLPLCLLAGLFSAVYGLSLEAGAPIAAAAEKYGAGNFQGNVIYLFSNTGAFVTTFLYCGWLHQKEKTWAEFFSLPKSLLTKNWLLSALTGVMWYFQFFFYGLGHVQMGVFSFSSWAIHMIMLVLFSNVAAWVFKEWFGVHRSVKWKLLLGLTLLLCSVLLITLGTIKSGD